METTVLSFQERLESIVEQSYEILSQQVVMGKFRVFNEASLQMQFAIILSNVGHLYEFGKNDQFEIELEENIDLNLNTSKSKKGKARCDIWLRLSKDGRKVAECAIELKCFLKQPDGETTTDNRKSILQDIENLENYIGANKKLIRYEIVYTNNPNYTNQKTSSYINLGDGQICTGRILHPITKQTIAKLANRYIFKWDEYPANGGHYFLKVQVHGKN